MQEFKRLLSSFQFAIQGIKDTLLREKNMQIHGWISLVISLLSIWAGIPWWQYLIILFMICLVLALELLNTAIESTFDLISKDYHDHIKKGKDAAAGAVFILSIFSVLIGFTILYKPIESKITEFHIQLTNGSGMNAIRLAILLCVWLFLCGLLIKWNRTFKTSLVLNFAFLGLIFAIFIWLDIAWVRLIVLLTPIFFVIFLRRGYATLFGFYQIFVSGFGVYLIYYLLK